MKTHLILAFLFLFLCISCNKGYYINNQGGLRLNKKHTFKYQKKKFALKDTLLIDTNAIYLRESGCKAYGVHTYLNDSVYYRFWGNGRVQQVYCEHRKISNLVNNIECGEIGYYYISRGRLKIQLIGKADIGWGVWFQFGFFEKKDIWIFEQNPDTYFGSYLMLKWCDSNSRSKWIKTKVDNIKYVKPNW